jgi:hypothetical protein
MMLLACLLVRGSTHPQSKNFESSSTKQPSGRLSRASGSVAPILVPVTSTRPLSKRKTRNSGGSRDTDRTDGTDGHTDHTDEPHNHIRVPVLYRLVDGYTIMRSTFMPIHAVADRTPQVRLHIHVKRRSMPASNDCDYTLMRAADSPSSQAEVSHLRRRVRDPPRPSAPACICPFRRAGSRTGSRRQIRRQSPGHGP